MYACRHCKKFIMDASEHKDYLGSNYHVACLEKVMQYKHDCGLAKLCLCEVRNMIEDVINIVREDDESHLLINDIENHFKTLITNISWLNKSL